MGWWGWGWGPKKSIAIFGYKQWHLSLEMKTKVVQHVPRINFSYLKFQIFKFSNFQIFKFSNFQIFKFSLVPSFCLTFRHFLKFHPTSPVHPCWLVISIIYSCLTLGRYVFVEICYLDKLADRLKQKTVLWKTHKKT